MALRPSQGSDALPSKTQVSRPGGRCPRLHAAPLFYNADITQQPTSAWRRTWCCSLSGDCFQFKIHLNATGRNCENCRAALASSPKDIVYELYLKTAWSSFGHRGASCRCCGHLGGSPGMRHDDNGGPLPASGAQDAATALIIKFQHATAASQPAVPPCRAPPCAMRHSQRAMLVSGHPAVRTLVPASTS